MLILSAPKNSINSSIRLSGSKSISNRLLILNEVLNLGLTLQNCSTSEDTLLLKQALQQIKNTTSATIDIGHAGTDMRFLTTLLSTKKGEWILTGSERMKQRPIGELVSALKLLGAEIDYLEKENFPPLKITGKKLNGGKLEIDGSISSQFISAILLISPTFENGLELTLKNEIVSWPYIQMTLYLLNEFGIKTSVNSNTINVSNSKILNLKPDIFKVESDWSSASYWYSVTALSKDATLTLTGLHEKSLQADSVLPAIYKNFGVTSSFKNGNLILTKNSTVVNSFNYDFTNCPDIAQTIAVTCFALGIEAILTGLKTLKIKESDRIVALKNELEKFGANVVITKSSLTIDKGYETQDIKLPTANCELIKIETHNDHRMAMSFAPLALMYKQLNIQSPEVVLKSYPLFWEDLKSVGFNVTLQP